MANAYLSGLAAIAPELVLTGTALAALVFDLVTKGRDSRRVGYLALGGLALTSLLLIGQWGEPPRTVLGMVTVDQFGNFFKLFTCASLAAVVVFVLNDRRERRHGIGEYYFLLLGAAVGVFFMVSTNNLLLLMLGLELLSLASYSLAGFHKGDRKSAEAAMKYVVFGGLSAGIMLYGISLLYGLTGTIDLAEMASADGSGHPAGLAGQLAQNPIPVAVAVVLILAGFAYKVSLVPFHFWTPDVYEGAPTPVTTFLAVGSKAAGFGALLRFVGALFVREDVQDTVRAYGERVGLLIAILAAVTMTVGNLSALRQRSLKRMLAFSSIAHAGYVMIGVAAMSAGGFEAAMYYLAAYYFMNLGAFGFLLYFEGVTSSDDIDGLKGLGWRAPLVSIAMVVFLVSLTGLPPTVGFYGKYLLFQEGVAANLIWLVVIAGLNSVISLFYYFRVVRTLFLSKPAEREVAPQPLFVGLLAALGVATVFFALYTAPLVDWARRSMDLLWASSG
ncbi:MAG: NADH-quinone oxidoreductase subunit N [Planctomycetes bacterium]|nr:NADH-quinone oxidoreductase subunit N [Planctomycetota bacterium]MDP6408517.1 NADH-quinone oxidoreductase subunit N [Planctomycetota bacterium]